MAHTVKTAARLAGVSVRTLHHYDHLGLLVPSSVSEAGYRLYSDDDLARLQQILFFRTLGFELKVIKEVLDRPDFDRLGALHAHRERLAMLHAQFGTLLATCDRTIAALEGGQPMAPDDMFEGFDEKQMAAYQAEAEERWGHTEAWRQSQERMKHYTKADYQAMKAEVGALFQSYAEVMAHGHRSPEALACADRQFHMFNTKFYDMGLEFYRNLATMYVDDGRFAATFERIKPGQAVFVRDAIHAYCDREAAKA